MNDDTTLGDKTKVHKSSLQSAAVKSFRRAFQQAEKKLHRRRLSPFPCRSAETFVIATDSTLWGRSNLAVLGDSVDPGFEAFEVVSRPDAFFKGEENETICHRNQESMMRGFCIAG
jgi:hypothetical protein